MRIAYLELKEEIDLEAQVAKLTSRYKGAGKLAKFTWSADGTFTNVCPDGTSKDILRVLFSKGFGTDFLKFIIPHWVAALSPLIGRIVIPEDDFVKFIRGEKVADDSCTMKFWELNPPLGLSRSIIAWRENPEVWADIQVPLRATGRGTTWAGVEFTHPAYGLRVAVYRYPTAAFWGIGTAATAPNLSAIQKKFEAILC